MARYTGTKMHAQSHYSTDTMSRAVTTICGRFVPRENAVRFRSELFGRRDACSRCKTMDEDAPSRGSGKVRGGRWMFT